VGSAAALVTDVPSRRADAKYELVRTLRTHHGVDDAAFNAALHRCGQTYS
jgi:3-ketoacyl-CoA synthase